MLTSMSDAAEAQKFGDYLTAIGIKNTVEEGNSGHAIWIINDDDLDRSKSELQQFSANPNDAKYASAGKIAKAQRDKEEKRQRKLRKNYVDVRTNWAMQSWQTPPLSLSLIVACLVVSMFDIGFRGYSPLDKWLYFTWPVTGERGTWDELLRQLKTGQVWRLVTPVFMHGGLLHLLFNLFWLRDLGTAIERRKGPLVLGALVLVSAILSNTGQYFASGAGFAGMSGVVYALFGYVWMKGKFQPSENLGLPPQTVTIMLLWLIICYSGALGSIANTAHLVGLLVGVVAGASKGFLDRTRRKMKWG